MASISRGLAPGDRARRRPRRRRRGRGAISRAVRRRASTTVSPRANSPSTRCTPAGSRLLPRRQRARRRRRRPCSAPGRLERAGDPVLAGASPGWRSAGTRCSARRRSMAASGFCRVPDGDDHGACRRRWRSCRPRSWCACRRATVRTPAPPAIASISGRDARRRTGMKRGVGIECRRRGVEPVDVGEQHQQVGAHHGGDARRQAVVVAVADLGGRDRVVLVDDRHGAQLAAACRCVARALR